MTRWPSVAQRRVAGYEVYIYKVDSSLTTICLKISAAVISLPDWLEVAPLLKLCPLRVLKGRLAWRAASR